MKAVMFERALQSVGTDVGVPLPRRQPRWLLAIWAVGADVGVPLPRWLQRYLLLLLRGLPRSLLLLPAAGLGAAMGAAAVAAAAAVKLFRTRVSQ